MKHRVFISLSLFSCLYHIFIGQNFSFEYACVSLILLHVWHLSNHFSLPEAWKHSTSVYYCRQLKLKPNCPKILIKVQECSLQQKEIPVSKHFHINPLSNNVRFSLLHQSSCGLRSSVQTLFKLQIPILNQSNLAVVKAVTLNGEFWSDEYQEFSNPLCHCAYRRVYRDFKVAK